MSKRVTALLFGCAAGAGTVGLAQAADTQAGLDEVVITGHRLEESLPQQLAQFGTRVDIVDRDHIVNGSYLDVAQSLQALAPGLYIQPKNGPFDYADISLLGSRTDDVLWLLDGIRLNNRLYSGTPPFDTLPAGMIERMEVLEGGQALFYGTAAVAGAVNIVTHPFTEELKGGVSFAGDSNENRHADAHVSDSFGRNHLVVFGSYDDSDGYRAFRKQDYQPSATDRERGYNVWTAGAKYGFDITEDLQITASGQHTEADVDNALPYRVARNVNAREEEIASLKLDYTPSETLGLYLKGYYHTWHTSFDTTYNSLITPGATQVLYDDAFWGYDDKGLNALARFSFTKGVDYFLGYDMQRYGGRDEVLVIEQNKEETQAFFAQVRTTPDLLPKTHFSAGVRYNSPDVGESATVWNVTGQYDISDALFFRTTFGTNFRLPTAEELFANDPGYERGNPDLKPERSRSINLSFGGLAGESLHWELTGFAREIEDLIDYGEYDDVAEQDVFANVAGTVKVRGVQAALSGALSADWSTGVSFTYNRSRVEGDQLARIPEQVAKLSLDFHPAGQPFGAAFNVNYTGSAFVPLTIAPGPGGTFTSVPVEYGKYAVVDLSGRYVFGADQRQKIVLSLQNVLDEEYGRPARGCADVAGAGPSSCGSPYKIVNLGLPRTVRASYTYAF